MTMKHLKNSFYMILLLTFVVSCEKEMVTESEIVLEDQKNEILDFKENGDIIYQINSQKELELVFSKSKKNTIVPKSMPFENQYVQLSESEFEAIDCGLNFEDFTPYLTGSQGGAAHQMPLNSFTNNGWIRPGDIVEGISIYSDSPNIQYGLFIYNDIPFSYGENENEFKYIVTCSNSQNFDPKLHLNFTSEESVNIVSFKLFPANQNTNVLIEVWGEEDIFLGQTFVDDAYLGKVFSIYSEMNIKRVDLSFEWDQSGIDDLYFGSFVDQDNDGIGDACDTCPNDPDNDIDGDGICGDIDNCASVYNPSQANWDGDAIGDSCDDDDDNDGELDDDDNHPKSNMSEEIGLDGIFPGVANVFIAPGTTMMDKIDDVIAGVWEKMYSPNVRRNFDPQKQFQRDMSVLLNSWYRRYDRILSDADKFKITKAVRQSRIFEDRN